MYLSLLNVEHNKHQYLSHLTSLLSMNVTSAVVSDSLLLNCSPCRGHILSQEQFMKEWLSCVSHCWAVMYTLSYMHKRQCQSWNSVHVWSHRWYLWCRLNIVNKHNVCLAFRNWMTLNNCSLSRYIQRHQTCSAAASDWWFNFCTMWRNVYVP